jgi:hypothetical protein
MQVPQDEASTSYLFSLAFCFSTPARRCRMPGIELPAHLRIECHATCDTNKSARPEIVSRFRHFDVEWLLWLVNVLGPVPVGWLSIIFAAFRSDRFWREIGAIHGQCIAPQHGKMRLPVKQQAP